MRKGDRSDLNADYLTWGFGRDKRPLTDEELFSESTDFLIKVKDAMSIEPCAFMHSEEYDELMGVLDKLVKRVEDWDGYTDEVEEEERQEMSHPDYINHAMRDDLY